MPCFAGILRLVLVAALACVVCGGGCVERRVIRSDWDNFPADPKPDDPGKGRDAGRAPMYAVELATFEGPNRQRAVMDRVRELRRETGLTNLWVSDTGERAVLRAGRFRNPNDLDARFALRQAREVKIDGDKPFADAKLMPIRTGYADPGVELDPADLRQFAGTPDYHTLEVAIFTPAHGRYRAAAEKMANKLRDEGHDAYFYHGPNASSVTVGLFTRDDWDLVGTVETYGPRIKALQEAFPHLRVNGEKPYYDEQDPSKGYEPTKIVRVPSFR